MVEDTEQTPLEPTHRVSTSGDVEVSTYLEIASEGARGRPGYAEGEGHAAPPSQAKREAIIVFDFGSQYSRLIARRIREQNVYCEILPPEATRDAVKDIDLRGIIGSMSSSHRYGIRSSHCRDPRSVWSDSRSRCQSRRALGWRPSCSQSPYW